MRDTDEENSSPQSAEDIDSSSSIKNREKTIDELLTKAGPYNRFHAILQISTIYLCLTLAYNFVLSYFTGNNPPWRCLKSNSSHFCELYYNKSISSDSVHFYQRCKLNRSEWSYTTPKKYSFVTEFDLVCDKTSVAAMVSASFYMGGILISVVSGNIADRYGRKPVLVSSILATIISSIGCSFVTNVWQLAGVYAVRGAASVACYYTVFVYQMELAPPSYRLISSNLMVLSASCSFMLIDLISFVTKYWRMVHIYAALPGLLSLATFTFLPESPRWLLVNDRSSRARDVMEKINKFNDKKADVIYIKSPTGTENRKYTYLDLCRSMKVIKLTLSIATLWFTFAVVFYTIAMESSNLGGNIYQAFALSTLADFPSCFICSYVCDRFGRKKSILVGLFISGILLGSMSLIPKSLSYRFIINMIIIFTARLVNGTAFSGVYTWSFELFPTVLRSQGMSVCVILEWLGMFAVPFLTRVLQRVSFILPFLIMCALAIVTSIIGLILPETNKLPTRELYEDFCDKTTENSFNGGIENTIVQGTQDDVQV